MKTKNQLLKRMLVALFFFGAMPMLFAQIVAPIPSTPIGSPGDLDVGTITNDALPVTTVNQAVLFYDPSTNGPSLNIKASLNDNDDNEFDEYIWNEITNSAGTETENLISVEISETLFVEELEPGYHKYRVYGVVDDGATCQSDEFEDIILFVLPPLDIEAEYASASEVYCEDDVPEASDAIELAVTTMTADYSANTNGYEEIDPSDFSLEYQWYYESADELGNLVAMGTGETQEVNLTDPGTYTFYVDVIYDENIKEDVDDNRDYVIFSTQVEFSGSPFEVIVNELPGNPTISIDDINE